MSDPVPNHLPTAAKLVWKVLEYEGPLSQKRLVRETNLSERSVIRGINALEDEGLVERRHSTGDGREKVVHPDAE